MPTQVKGAVELRKALRQFAPDLAKETQKEIAAVLKPITAKARGFIPSNAPLSGWAKPSNGSWENRQWSSSEAKRGIGYKTTPSKPNSRGFRALARIVNASAAGSIYELAGKNNPQGREQAPIHKVAVPGHANFGKSIRSGTKEQSRSNNPYAGKQFIDAMNETGRIVDAFQRGQGQAGRASRKFRGRAIFRAWAEDGGKANLAVIKAIETSAAKLNATAKGRR
jgi:hypothetical protein